MNDKPTPVWLRNACMLLREWGGFSEAEIRKIHDGEMERLRAAPTERQQEERRP